MAQSLWPVMTNRICPKAASHVTVALCFYFLLGVNVLMADQEEQVREKTAPRYGLGLNFGLGYNPSDARNFMSVTGVALYDYEDIWPHRAPEQLRFKLEGSLGGTSRSDSDFMASAGFLALYYLDSLSSSFFRPYIEGGAGLIFTEYKVKGQGSRLNFNPQVGLGMEITPASGFSLWMSMRLHHLSNAGINKDNRGVNSMVFQMGKYF
ncbi:MAG: acyloxyacyl hydrolase [Desulfonatronovibrio sp.]